MHVFTSVLGWLSAPSNRSRTEYVERGVHIDAGIHDRENVLPAFGMEQPGGIRVGHLVDEQHLRPAGNGAVEVEFPERVAAIGNRQAGQHLQSLHERCGVGPAVRFDDPDDDIGARGGESLR
jgi:hypothetical protein